MEKQLPADRKLKRGKVRAKMVNCELFQEPISSGDKQSFLNPQERIDSVHQESAESGQDQLTLPSHTGGIIQAASKK